MREISCARELQVGANLGQCLATPEELWREGSIRTGEVKSHFFYKTIAIYPFKYWKYTTCREEQGTFTADH